jgi:hypothetical protein
MFAVSCLIVGSAAASADARIPTTTMGRVCCPHVAGQLENYGGYIFKGKTTPLFTGPYVYFRYKRPAWSRWRAFKVGIVTGGGFFARNKNFRRDRINDRDRWRILFSSGERQGYWKIRAVFRAQDGYARSKVIKKYWVWAVRLRAWRTDT